MAETRKILIIKLSALGDFVQALGAMAAIRRHHPDADITLLTTEPFVSMGRACGYVDHIWTDERPKLLNLKGWLSLRRRLNKAGFDRVYDLQNNDRTALYFRLFKRKPEWVGTVKGASHRNTSPKQNTHAWDRHVQTLALAGITDITIDTLDWIDGDIGRFDIPSPYVLLVPGCAPNRPEKRWPADYFAILARTLYGWGYTPVIIGTVAETDIARQIHETVPHTLDLTGQTALFDIAVLARHAAAAIGNDTGPMHIIGPTGCPSWVLFSGHSDPLRHAPRGEHVRTISAQDLAALTPEQVIDHLSVRDFRN